MDQPKRHGRFLWDGLNRGTAWLYNRIARSPVGRLMTGYRRANRSFATCFRKSDRHSCHPMSPARLRLVETVESGRLFGGLKKIFGALFACPGYFYGLFGLVYGLAGVILYLVAHFWERIPALPLTYVIWSALIAAVSLITLPSQKSLSELLGAGRFSRWLLVGFFGLPADRLCRPRGKAPSFLPYLAILLGLCGGLAAYFIGPLVIPLCILSFAVLGLVFTYPEAGVVLSTVLLPAVWMDKRAVWALAALILLTWCSFGLKLLFLHRTAHFGLLDAVVLIFGLLILLSGVTETVVTVESVLQSVLLFICLSDYFLVVNLITTRAYVRRCLIGMVASVILVTLLSYARMISVEDLAWLAGSRAGDLVVDAAERALTGLSALWAEHAGIFLVLIFPWLYALLVYAKRLRGRAFWVLFIVLDLGLLMMSGSVSALLCVLFGTVLFILLLSPKSLSACLVGLPAVAVAGGWLNYLSPMDWTAGPTLSRSIWYREQLYGSLWQMVLDYPGGIGLGEASFTTVYAAYSSPHLGAVSDFRSLWYEILLGLGWPGLLVFVTLLFFFFQKGFTALRHTAAPKDRAMILGGITSLSVILLFGTVRSFISSPRMLFTIVLVIALTGAYENIIFDESDVLTTGNGGTSRGEDRIYRRY